MYKIETNIELPIAHCLYRGAYSGLCCGNVYRDMNNDGQKERYDLGDKIFPIVHAHSYRVTISLSSNELDKNGMVVDFKKLKKILNGYFDKYYNSTILTPDNPLCQLYLNNFKENNLDAETQGLFVWDSNPTAEYMSKYWHEAVTKELENNNIVINKLKLSVEETTHNLVEFE